MVEQDIHNYSSSSSRTSHKSIIILNTNLTDRLPTLSATQALQNLASTPCSPITTRLQHLDRLLQGREYGSPTQDDLPGGIFKGEVTEIFGPPGVGKTSLAYVIP